MSKISSYPIVNATEQDLIIVSEVNGTPSDVTKNIQVKSIIDLAGTAIITGMINNFASQGSGGYDFMEWTSNVTPDTQIPLFKVPCDMQLQKVGWIWCGAAPLTITGTDNITISIGQIPDDPLMPGSGQDAVIGNYVEDHKIVTFDNTNDGTRPSGIKDFTSSQTAYNLQQGDNLAVVATEVGTIMPMDGELSLSFYFRLINSSGY